MVSDALTQAIERALKKTPKGVTVERLQLFGSRLSKQHRPDSDFDFLLDYSGNLSFIGLMHLQISLAEELHATVDLIPRESIHPVIRSAVLASAKTVYEKR